MFYRGDESVVLTDADDLPCVANGLNEALIVKIRGVLGPSEDGLKEIALLSCIARYDQTADARPLLECEAGPRDVEIIMETLGLRRSGAIKILSSTGKKTCMDVIRKTTGLNDEHARNCRTVCLGIN